MKIVYLYANLTHNDQMFLQDSQASVMFQKPCVLPKLLFTTYTCMTSRKGGASEIKVAVFLAGSRHLMRILLEEEKNHLLKITGSKK